MRHYKLLLPTLLLITALIVTNLSAQVPEPGVKYVAEIEDAFRQALKLYQTKNYQKSTPTFEKLTKFNPVHQRITLCYLMYGKSLIKQDRYREAIVELRHLVSDYPHSRYLEHGKYEIGTAFYLLGNYLAATREFLWVLDYAKSPVLSQQTKTLLEYLLEQSLSLTDIQQLIAEIPGEKSLGLLVYKLAEKQAAQGNSDAVLNTVVDFMNKHPRNEYVKPLEKYLNKLRSAGKAVATSLKIGVILPLNEGYAEDGKGILRGLNYALSEYQSENNPQKVELIIRDSGSNVVKAIKIVQAMQLDESIIALVGELESDITAAMAAIIQPSKLPLFAPIASQYGLASIGEQIFQVNSDLFERGRQMAFYAIDSLGMKTFAALAPADDYGREMVAGFMAGVQKNNGIFIGPPKWYYHGSKDLSRQIRAVRALGFEYLKKDSTWARRNAHLLARSHIDSGAVAITSIDGLFCPVYTEDIQYIGPQCANLQIRTRLLGGDYWFDADALSANQSYINGVVFVSDYYVDEYNPDYRRFRAQFRIKTGKDFGRLEAFGYDTMKALLKVIQENNVTNRQMLIEKVNTLNAFKGIKSDISWKGNARVNADVNILEYNGGLLKKLR